MLHHFDQPLVAITQPRLRAIDRRVGLGGRRDARRGEHEAVHADVRVVRDDDGLAAPDPLPAIALESLEEAHRRDRVHRRERLVGHRVVAEEHVSMEVARDRRGPFVADQAREAAGRAAIVGLLRRVLDLAPDAARDPQALLAAGPAELVPLSRRVRPGEEPEQGHRRVPLPPTRVAVVFGMLRVVADPHLAEHLRVVRERRPVERAVELHPSPGHAFGAPGLDPDLLAPREAIGVARRRARILGARVVGEPGMDVGVAEERATQRIVVAAGLPLLRHGVGPLPARRRGRSRRRRRQDTRPAHAKRENEECDRSPTRRDDPDHARVLASPAHAIFWTTSSA